ncbi:MULTISPECIES: hypothetical protein [unclassified Bradyrhizobium]|uniref:hypothetical protein n=1 Tax=unclassified Bradyrhizobium TaxID=2631580 RepID=UPI00055997FA|nr:MULTISPECIES: hypothetical protein [unclassified Bradyrhizobium]MCP3464305.1 hypothetical protein [Bradyrhizobium sp. CCGUVB23]
MNSLMMSALIAVGATSVICFVLMTHVQNRSRWRSRAGAGADSGDSYSGSTDGFALGSWFSSDTSSVDSSGSPSDSGSCSVSSDSGSSDSGGSGGDCGGGGDSGGGGGGD